VVVGVIIILIILIDFNRVGEVMLLVYDYLVVSIVRKDILKDLIDDFGVALAYWND